MIRTLTASTSPLCRFVRSSFAFNLPAAQGVDWYERYPFDRFTEIGSHVLLIGAIDSETGCTHDRLANISAMYAEWLKRMGRAPRSLA